MIDLYAYTEKKFSGNKYYAAHKLERVNGELVWTWRLWWTDQLPEWCVSPYYIPDLESRELHTDLKTCVYYRKFKESDLDQPEGV